MNEQLALGLQLRASARFSNFVAAGNAELVEQVKALAARAVPRQIYCWGAPGAGKTHLLQAACRHAAAGGRATAYLSLRDSHTLPPDVLGGWERFQLVCLDDADALAADAAWEEALFHLYNRLAETRGGLLVAAGMAPAQLAAGLPDLVSRLGAGPVYHLRGLDEEHSLQALRLRASERGFELPVDTGRYLLRRLPRDLPALMDMLERLDVASLAAQRKLTVPFVKSVLGL